MDDVVAFTEESVRAYLDAAIKEWRNIRDSPGTVGEVLLIARCNIDVFQSVRVSLFGETLGAIDEG